MQVLIERIQGGYRIRATRDLTDAEMDVVLLVIEQMRKEEPQAPRLISLDEQRLREMHAKGKPKQIWVKIFLALCIAILILSPLFVSQCDPVDGSPSQEDQP